MPSLLLLRVAVVTVALLGSGMGQVIRPELRARMDAMAVGEKVPVYFVMADRLGYDHWFPRVNPLSVDERRLVVMAELRDHADRTQSEVLQLLRDASRRGEVEGIFSNWLGNFVQCRAEVRVIEAVVGLPDVAEAWLEVTPPVSELVDGGAVAPVSNGDWIPPLASPPPPGGSSPPPGNGPLSTRAHLVWCLGIMGTGVVVMNADLGINAGHFALRNRLWVNLGEIPGNGLDDDGNGFIDDVNGWNFSGSNANLDDSGNHGTHTAGCLVADASCSGLAFGQAPAATVMTAVIASEVSQWNAIQYAILMGAHCQTSSLSFKMNFGPPNLRMHRDVADSSLAAGLIRTNSTSNNGLVCSSSLSVNRRPFNIAAPGCVPAPYVDPNQLLVGRKGGVLGVGAHDLSSGMPSQTSPCGPFAWSLADLLVVVPGYNVANWDLVNHDDYPWSGGAQQGLIKPDLTGTSGTTTPGSGSCGTVTFSGTSNATPNVCGTFVLWKSANPSLKPEDVAMIAHQTATPTGSIPGKENRFGAGRIDARAGLGLALCVHRIDGEPAWSVTHSVSQPVRVELDGVPGSNALIAVGTTRTSNTTHGGTVGLGGTTFFLWQGTIGASGDVVLLVPLPPVLAGASVFTQAFLEDTTVTGGLLSSNVIETRFVP